VSAQPGSIENSLQQSVLDVGHSISQASGTKFPLVSEHVVPESWGKPSSWRHSSGVWSVHCAPCSPQQATLGQLHAVMVSAMETHSGPHLSKQQDGFCWHTSLQQLLKLKQPGVSRPWVGEQHASLKGTPVGHTPSQTWPSVSQSVNRSSRESGTPPEMTQSDAVSCSQMPRPLFSKQQASATGGHAHSDGKSRMADRAQASVHWTVQQLGIWVQTASQQV
jgi:hypothetical protein